MPFEPRLVHGEDDPERDLILAPDLVELADQLCEEASSLANRYPASTLRQPEGSQTPDGQTPDGQTPGSRANRPLAGQWLRWRGVAAAAMVSTAIWGLSHGWTRVEQPAAPRGRVVRLIDGGVDAPMIQNVNSSLPATFFQELTGSEREGLLDLLEEERLDQSSLSI